MTPSAVTWSLGETRWASGVNLLWIVQHAETCVQRHGQGLLQHDGEVIAHGDDDILLRSSGVALQGVEVLQRCEQGVEKRARVRRRKRVHVPRSVYETTPPTPLCEYKNVICTPRWLGLRRLSRVTPAPHHDGNELHHPVVSVPQHLFQGLVVGLVETHVVWCPHRIVFPRVRFPVNEITV